MDDGEGISRVAVKKNKAEDRLQQDLKLEKGGILSLWCVRHFYALQDHGSGCTAVAFKLAPALNPFDWPISRCIHYSRCCTVVEPFRAAVHGNQGCKEHVAN